MLFCLDAERAHGFVFQLLKKSKNNSFLQKIAASEFCFLHPSLQFNLFGQAFKNPVGLAAGFDKNCEIFEIMPHLGFGFVECGTVTAQAQKGNPRPRIFRLPQEQALINRLAFNSFGADWVQNRLQSAARSQAPLGMNIGKSAATPLDLSAGDYLYSFEKLYPFADYFAVNVSSPNTAHLRDLEKDCSPLLAALQSKNEMLAQISRTNLKPIFVKISPDIAFADLDKISESCIQHKVAGLIATNTTPARAGIKRDAFIEGGLSGKPLESRSTEMIRYLYKRVGKKLILIGVGGIFSAEDAYRKIKAGASLIQIYTGWVYEGPALIPAINRGLASFLERDGLKNIREAVGVET